MKKVYPAEWVTQHPYKHSGEADRYYADLATRINKVLTAAHLEDDLFDLRSIGIRLTEWFEDIISETRIWTTFTKACKQRYGAYLPFYKLDENYIPGEVNFEDIAFLLWHNMQSYCNGERVLNPENPGIQAVAIQVCTLLEQEYETAPENEPLYEALYGQSYGPEDFYRYREILQWFHYQSYFNVLAQDELEDHIEQLAEHKNINDFIENHDPYILIYAIRQELLFRSRNPLMAFTSPEWMARMAGDLPGLATWKDVRLHPGFYFLYDGEDLRFVYLKDITGNGERLAVSKLSIKSEVGGNHWIAGKSMLKCQLVAYGGCWWQNGMLTYSNEQQGNDRLILDEERDRREKATTRRDFETFRKASGGRPYVILKSQDALKDFLTAKMGFTLEKGVEIPRVDEKTGCMATATPNAGMQILNAGIPCIKSPENPFYDEQKARKNGLMLYANPEALPYELCCYLQDKGMLTDAGLNSLKGKEYGRSFLQQNRNFITDYFFRKCREKDYDEDAFTTP